MFTIEQMRTARFDAGNREVLAEFTAIYGDLRIPGCTLFLEKGRFGAWPPSSKRGGSAVKLTGGALLQQHRLTPADPSDARLGRFRSDL